MPKQAVENTRVRIACRVALAVVVLQACTLQADRSRFPDTYDGDGGQGGDAGQIDEPTAGSGGSGNDAGQVEEPTAGSGNGSGNGSPVDDSHLDGGPDASDVLEAGNEDFGPPRLQGLALDGRELVPSFDPDVTSYQVRLPLVAPTLTLTASAAQNTWIHINGATIDSHAPWISNVMPLGVATLTIAVGRDGHAERVYAIEVTRGDRMETYIKAGNNRPNLRFGESAALDGDTLVVGASKEASAATGIVHDPEAYPDDDDAEESGAAYVFVRNGSTWEQQAYLKASNSTAGITFGVRVAISGDTIAVSAPNEASAGTGVNPIDPGPQDTSAPGSGAVYVFVRNGTTWTEQAYIKASNAAPGSWLGIGLALEHDTLVVGAPLESSAATGVNNLDPGQWDIGAPRSGAAYVFVRNGTSWEQQAYLKASNARAESVFGVSIGLSGNTIVVGSPTESSSATGVNNADPGSTDESAAGSGAAYIFVRSGSTWAQNAYLKASNNSGHHAEFGAAVAIDGDRAVVGARFEPGSNHASGSQGGASAPNSGAAYVFLRSGSRWEQEAYLKASNNRAGMQFGESVALRSDTILISAPAEASSATGVHANHVDGDAVVELSGAAYLFARTDNGWVQTTYFKAPNPQQASALGTSITMSAEHLVLGAWGESGAGTGVHTSIPDEEPVERSGAVYAY